MFWAAQGVALLVGVVKERFWGLRKMGFLWRFRACLAGEKLGMGAEDDEEEEEEDGETNSVSIMRPPVTRCHCVGVSVGLS